MKDHKTLTKWGILKILQATGIVVKRKPDKSLVNYQDRNLIITNDPNPIIGGSYLESIYIITVDPQYLAPGHTQTNYVLKKNKWAFLGKNKVMTKEDFGNIKSINTPIKELTDLKKVQSYIIPKLKNYKYAKISAIGNSVSFLDTKQTDLKQGEKQYFVVLDAADGEDLDTLFDEPNKNFVEWRKMMFNVGRALGELHFLLSDQNEGDISNQNMKLEDVKTIPHGDLHVGNVFYNQKNGDVNFIDTGSMADFLKSPGSPMKDLKRFFAISKYQHRLYDNLSHRHNILNKDFIIFADGYSQGFSQNKTMQENIKNEIIEYFKKISNDFVKYLLSDGNDKQVDPDIHIYVMEALLDKSKEFLLKEASDDSFVSTLNRDHILKELKAAPSTVTG